VLISDFFDLGDRIDFSDFGITLSDLNFFDQVAGVLITIDEIGDVSVFLDDVFANELAPGDFIF
jgi:hypothetical protein